MAMNGKNRIMIYGPKADGTYLVEFKTAAGESLAISVPGSEAAVRICRCARVMSSCAVIGYVRARECLLAPPPSGAFLWDCQGRLIP